MRTGTVHAAWQRGLSLIELMIAMLIGLVLVLGVVQVFIASRSAYALSQGLARVQENGRFAVDYLSRDIRMAGHMGCKSDQILGQDAGTTAFLAKYTTFGTAPVAALAFNYAIEGYEADGTAPSASATVTLRATPAMGGTLDRALPTGWDAILDNRVAGSDILVLRYLDGEGVPIAAAATGAAPVLALAATADDWNLVKGGLDNPGLFGLTNCDTATVFHAQSASKSQVAVGAATGLNAGATTASFAFDQGALLYRAESEIYYVGLNTSTNRPSLYRVRFIAAPAAAAVSYVKEELVEGVENMQILYGQDSTTASSPTGAVARLDTASGIQASDADKEKAWRRVVSVQLGLLLTSPDPASAQAPEAGNELVAQGVRFTPPADGRMRTVYQTTVTLRNRLYGN